ncbi:hypothetical protein PAXINDRAFT_157257 [Paxillus involutus ATCC 200175]|uniref:Uncharacterized protein n=1 Tax=Paxillus involutus ATCC 200175 TaxID=664439 RepID=A0A0C9SSY4_PAXIN|nr:hypothetical protein PAXINDRAFT_157257 [Paxillus involutus ATCC 200175]
MRGMKNVISLTRFAVENDEAHVINQWGCDFHQAYAQIGLIHKHIGYDVPVIAATATLVEGWQFPDILWVIQTGERVIVSCKSIDLLFRVALYLCRSLPPSPKRLKIVRVWELPHIGALQHMHACLVGRIVNLGIPESLSLDIQQRGRAGWDLDSAALGITYVKPSVMKRVAASLEEDMQKQNGEDCQSTLSKMKKTKGRGKPQANMKSSETMVEANMMVVLKAHITGACLCVAINSIYQNPGEKSLTSCISATINPITTIFTCRLPCSSCQPFWEADVRPQPFPQPPNFVIPPNPPNPPGHSSKLSAKMSGPAPPLTKKMRENAFHCLERFACQHWMLKDRSHFRYIPYQAFWGDGKHKHLIEVFHLIRSQETLNMYLHDWEFLPSDGLVLYELNQCYDGKTAAMKVLKVQKAAEMRVKKKAIVEQGNIN